jgi:hypothetical protein
MLQEEFVMIVISVATTVREQATEDVFYVPSITIITTTTALKSALLILLQVQLVFALVTFLALNAKIQRLIVLPAMTLLSLFI